jgi:hypothetical protein
MSLQLNGLNLAVQAAGMCVERNGAMESIPERTVVEARLHEHGWSA